MKKMLVIALILTMVLSEVVLAETDKPLAGRWIGIRMAVD